MSDYYLAMVKVQKTCPSNPDLPGATQTSSTAGVSIKRIGDTLIVTASLRVFWHVVARIACAAFFIAGSTPFLCASIQRFAQRRGQSLPSWFPNPKVHSGAVSASLTKDWLWSVALVMGGLLLIVWVVYRLFGVVRVTLNTTRGTVFTGVGPFGSSTHFTTNEVSKIECTDGTRPTGDGTEIIWHISLHANRPITFGHTLPLERRQAIVTAITSYLSEMRSRSTPASKPPPS